MLVLNTIDCVVFSICQDLPSCTIIHLHVDEGRNVVTSVFSSKCFFIMHCNATSGPSRNYDGCRNQSAFACLFGLTHQCNYTTSPSAGKPCSTFQAINYLLTWMKVEKLRQWQVLVDMYHDV